MVRVVPGGLPRQHLARSDLSTGFIAWHLAPQIILPYRKGRLAFLMGSAIVGGCFAFAAKRQGSVRWTTVSHIVTDSSGLRAARYRLGR